MRSNLILATVFCLALGSPVAATEAEDIGYILDRIMSENPGEVHRQIALAYLHVHSDWLRERSVKIIDQERFADVFPGAATEDWVETLRERVVGGCFARFSADELRDAAELLGEYPDGGSSEAVDLGASGQNVLFAAGLCWVMGALKLAEEIREGGEIPPGENIGYLADVLETEGVAAFPNRIVRRTVIEELRNSAR